MAKQELDEDLVEGLKAAKSKRCYFALVVKGGADGALVVSKTKIPPTAIAAAKKKSGGSAVVQGMVRYEDGVYVFETAKDPPATMDRIVKTIAKRDAGMTINVDCRKGSDPELLAIDGEGNGQATTTEPQKTGAKTGFSAVEFNKARASWTAAKQKVHSDMEHLSAAIRDEVPDEEDLGDELVKYIDEMLTALDNNLESALDAVVKAGTDKDRQAATVGALGVIDRYQKTVAINPGVKQVEKNPIMPLSILKPVNATLDVIKKYLNA